MHMPKYLISMYGPTAPDPTRDEGKDVEAHNAYGQQITTEGILRFACAVVDPDATVTLGNTHDHAADAEPKSALVGVYVIEIDSMDEALAVAQRNPINEQGGYLEVREIEA